MGESIAEVAAIAAKLTKNQEQVLVALTGDWSPAPHCGSWRRQGTVAARLVDFDLATRAAPGTRFQDTTAYRLTDTGIAVRNHLISQGADHDR